MGQLLEKRDCPICGKPMILALPHSGKGRRVLQCQMCDQPDPIDDDEVTGWLKGELRAPRQPPRAK
jgi:hypothetical protein